jgi:hypothetical protein
MGYSVSRSISLIVTKPDTTERWREEGGEDEQIQYLGKQMGEKREIKMYICVRVGQD